MARETRIEIRVSEEEKAQLEAAAGKTGVGPWVREQALKAAHQTDRSDGPVKLDIYDS